MRRLICCLLLALTTIALYNPVTRAPFLNYDDSIYVIDNPQVRAGLTWNTILWTFRTPAALDWHPITWLSFAFDSQMFGLNPAGFHIINVLIHAANAVFLFVILEYATGFAWRSLMVAALFALHPINVESVAWISERKNVLSMVFFLLALAAYGWYAQRPGVGRYLAVTFAYVLALMTKAQVITFPFALLLLDYWPLNRIDQQNDQRNEQRPEPVETNEKVAPTRAASFSSLIWEKVPWVALSVVSAVITMKTGGSAFTYIVETDATRLQLPLWIRMANAAISWVKYLEKTFWPANLALVYPHPGRAIRIPAALLSTLLIIAITILVIIFRQRRYYAVGWFWFLGILVPMIGFIPIGVHSMADRYAYIPLLGIFVIVCWGAADLLKTWTVPAAVAAAGSAAILLTLGFTLHRQVSFWTDNVTLWTHTLEITDTNQTAEDNLATALLAQGRVEEALPHLLRARYLRPDDPLPAINIATYEQMHGNYQAALVGYATVIQLTKTPSLLVTAWVNSGYAHYSLKQYARAKQDFEKALTEQPENSFAYRGLGLLAQKAGDINQAIRYYEKSAQLQPSPVEYLLLAQALEISGHPEAARATQSQAARMRADLSQDVTAVRQLLAD